MLVSQRSSWLVFDMNDFAIALDAAERQETNQAAERREATQACGGQGAAAPGGD
jgi:hypothetical protein